MIVTGSISVELARALDEIGCDGDAIVQGNDDDDYYIEAINEDIALALDLWRRGQDIIRRALRCPSGSPERIEGVRRTEALYAAALAVLAEMP